MSGPFRHAVYMGCGSGVLALEMAPEAAQVSGTDINPRPLALARINAAMNGGGRVRFLEGSLLDPLGDATVDQIVGNLPFVMSPDQSLIYRDGERPAAQLLREAIAGASRHLSPGGVAQMLCNWASDPAELAAEPQRLVAQSGLDAIAISYSNRTPREHAKNWNQSLANSNPQEFERVSDRWQEWFAAQNINSIAFGYLTLRRPIARAPSFRHFSAASWPVGNAGRHVARLLREMSGRSVCNARYGGSTSDGSCSLSDQSARKRNLSGSCLVVGARRFNWLAARSGPG
ncbi:methyltransferase [Pelagimonas varians]|uniref:methyltransferase n=1 Tax=Pelagimonas varians TaxID=696760 RepID=UPI0011416372|nr:methyltransferase [Pelagimonas varians]